MVFWGIFWNGPGKREDYVENLDADEYNEDFVKATMPYFAMILRVMSIARFIICLASIKEPRIGHFVMYYELLNLALTRSMPYDYGEVSGIVVIHFMIAIFGGGYTRFWPNLIAALLTVLHV